MAEQQYDLPRLAVETYRDEYRELSESWHNLDAKAQGVGAIAGIFLAAVFAWGQQLPEELGWFEGCLLIGSVVLLVATVIAAVISLHVRNVAAPPLGEETANMVSDIITRQQPEELPDRIAAFYNDQITAWKDTNKDMREKCLSKASPIEFGQVTLLLAAVSVAVLAIVLILSKL